MTHSRRDPFKQLQEQVAAESSDGLALIRDLANNPICSVAVDAEVPCIEVVWKRYATSLQLRYIHERIIQLLQQHSLDRILGDDTALPTIHAEDQTWIARDWMPRAIAAGLHAAAAKSAASHFGKLSTNSIRSNAPAGLAIQFFDTIEDARRWLQRAA